jgi:long-chain acyl-CoA synthetase
MLPRYENDHLLANIIGHNARIYPARDAIVCGDQRLTWSQLDSKTNQVGHALRRLGLVKGDKVCVFMPNSLWSFALFWGVVKAGCVIVPLNVMLDGSALARLINASDGTILFADPSTSDLIDDIRGDLGNIGPDRFYRIGEPDTGWAGTEALIEAESTEPYPVSIDPEDTMTVIYTSGTTGTPKGIEHSHFGRLNYPYGFAAGLGVNRYSVSICATPIYASGTWITMLPVMYNGGKIVLLPKFSAEAFLDAVEREGGSHTFMVPAQYITLLQYQGQPRDVSTLRVLVSAGQTISETTRAALGERFPGAGLYEVYGMTEGFFTIAVPEDFARNKPGTVGKPGFLEDIRILGEDDAELPAGEVGEIVAYGPGMMKGYYGRPDLTEDSVWVSPTHRTYLRSGDLGRLDEDGFLFVSGRKKDMIKSGGINIYAIDLEEVLMTHPDVIEVAVIGVPDPKWSETPIAVVIARDGAAVTDAALREWTNVRLSKYQRLSRVIFRTDLPRATYGKIQKDQLRQEYGHLLDP